MAQERSKFFHETHGPKIPPLIEQAGEKFRERLERSNVPETHVPALTNEFVRALEEQVFGNKTQLMGASMTEAAEWKASVLRKTQESLEEKTDAEKETLASKALIKTRELEKHEREKGDAEKEKIDMTESSADAMREKKNKERALKEVQRKYDAEVEKGRKILDRLSDFFNKNGEASAKLEKANAAKNQFEDSEHEKLKSALERIKDVKERLGG